MGKYRHKEDGYVIEAKKEKEVYFIPHYTYPANSSPIRLAIKDFEKLFEPVWNEALAARDYIEGLRRSLWKAWDHRVDKPKRGLLPHGYCVNYGQTVYCLAEAVNWLLQQVKTKESD